MAYVGTLENPEPLGKSLLASAGLHAAVGAVLVAGSLIHSSRASWGDKDPLGGAVGIHSTPGIPMLNRTGEKNPVANDSQSQVPQPPPKPKAKPAEKLPDPNAVPLKSRVPKKLAKAW